MDQKCSLTKYSQEGSTLQFFKGELSCRKEYHNSDYFSNNSNFYQGGMKNKNSYFSNRIINSFPRI